MMRKLFFLFSLFGFVQAEENFFDNYTIKDRAVIKEDLESQYYKGIDFSAEELSDLRSYQAKIPAGFLSFINLLPKQIENLKTTFTQREGVSFSSNQLSAMLLEEEQFKSLGLTKKQLRRLKISQFDDPKSSPLKYKLASKPTSLSSKDLSQLGLSGQQFFQLKINPEQLRKLKIKEQQLSILQTFSETKLSFEQYEQLNISPKQTREIVLTVQQLKRLQLLRFREFQPFLSASQLEKLELTSSQVIQLELSTDQILGVKLLPSQVSFLGLEFIKSNAQSLYLEKFASLQSSNNKLKSYQFNQLKLKSWQLQNIQFDQSQINILRRIFSANIMKNKYVDLINRLYPIQIAQLGLKPSQVKMLNLKKEQLESLELTALQLSEIGLSSTQIENYRKKSSSSSTWQSIISDLDKTKLKAKQISETIWYGEQFSNVIWEEEQLKKIKKFYNINVLRERLFEFLLTSQAEENKNAQFSNVQLSILKLNYLQLALINFDSYQLRKVGVSVSDYQTFRSQILDGSSNYSISTIKLKLNKIKLPAKFIINYFKKSGYRIKFFQTLEILIKSLIRENRSKI